MLVFAARFDVYFVRNLRGFFKLRGIKNYSYALSRISGYAYKRQNCPAHGLFQPFAGDFAGMGNNILLIPVLLKYAREIDAHIFVCGRI